LSQSINVRIQHIPQGTEQIRNRNGEGAFGCYMRTLRVITLSMSCSRH